MDGRRFDRLTRTLAARVGRRGALRAAVATIAAAAIGGAPRRGAAQIACADDRDCRSRDDACIGGRCEGGVCTQFIVDCVPGYVCCSNGECCPAPCTGNADCFNGDPCAVGVCGAEGTCGFTRREPCVLCAADAECAAAGEGAVCCGGACVRPCPEGMVLGKGCECQLPAGVGDASGVVAVDTDNGASNVRPTPSAPPTGGGVEVDSSIGMSVSDSPPSVVTIGSSGSASESDEDGA